MSGFEALHFIRPGWLLAVPLGIVLPWAWRRLRRPSGDWARVCDAHLLRWLTVGDASGRRSRGGSWLAGVALVAAAVSLAGPSWERLPDTAFSARDSRVLVLDLSVSMLAQDLKPDRLTRVRYRLLDLLAQTSEGQLGLVAFAGDAYVVSPLTSDTNTIANMLPALQPDIMPVSGSRADRGLALAAELLERSGAPAGEVLLITDAVRPAAVEAASRLAHQGIVTSVLAVGTEDGAPIPSGTGFVADGQGNVVIARLDLTGLRALAEAGGGRLSVLDSRAGAEAPWRENDGSEFSLRDEGLGERWKDMGPWLVLLLLPFAALAFRRGLLFSLVLLLPLAGFVPPARAGWWDDLWLRRDQQAQAALRDGQPAAAAGLARDPDLSGEAWYRSGDFARAAGSWQAGEGASAHFNRGNALAHAGDLDGAIAAYDAALALDPDMEDALFNRALLEQMKQQQEQQGEDQSGEGQAEDGQDGEPQQDETQGEEGEQEGEPRESEDESGQEGEGSRQQQMAQAWTEEDAQAMEQWLRRIPDDPGGLLRRKFRNQHQRRGAPADEAESW